MKYLIPIFFWVLTITCFGQASSSACFNLEIKFDNDINVENIQPYYYRTSGNNIRNIRFELNKNTNSMKLYGNNDFILWVPFPVITFTIIDNIKMPNTEEKVERRYNFYLVSEGPVSSYTGKQTKELTFSYENPTIIASLKFHNINDVYENLVIERANQHFFNRSIPIGIEMIKIVISE